MGLETPPWPAPITHFDQNQRFKEPADGSQPLNLRCLSATAFYHLRRIQTALTPSALGVADLTAAVDDHVDPWDDINVRLLDQTGIALYDWQWNRIDLYAGSQAGVEPGFDADILYHEFTHAMTDYFNPWTIRNQNRATRRMDEGLAFYFACMFVQDHQYAEYALQDISAWRDLESGPTTPADAITSGDPSGICQAMGTWWARAHWHIRTELNAPAFCSQMLLRALNSLPGGQLESRSVFALAMVAHAGTHVQAVTDILQSFEAFT